jgi:hypothetical protein
MAYTKKRNLLTAQPASDTLSLYNSTSKTYVDTQMFNASGTLTASRTVTMGGNSLTLDGAGDIVFADSGNITTAGDVAVNGGDLTTTATTAFLFDTNATTVNIAGAASTAVNIGNAAGTTTISSASTIITGTLTVNGGTTTINSTTLDIDDLNITLAKGGTNDASVNGAGITIEATTDGDKTFNYVSATDSWSSSEHVSLAAGKTLVLNGSTSGASTIQAAATTTSITYTLPSAAPTVSGYVLSSTTGGVMSWIDSSGDTDFSTKTANYTMVAGDNIILLDTSSNTVAITINPATLSLGKKYTAKIITDPATFAGTIALSSGTIDGEASYIFASNWESISFFTDGTNFFIL